MIAMVKTALANSNRRAWMLFFVFAIIAVKALVLFVAVPIYQAHFPTDYQADLFPDEYNLIAENLVAGNGYRFFPDTAATTIRSPGFVLALAGLFWAFGKGLTAVKVFHLILSTITAYFVYRLGLKITNNPAVAAIAALIYYLYPGTIVSDTRGGIETLLTFTIALFMLLMYRALETRKVLDYAAAGAAFGVMMLVRSSPGLFPAFLFVYLIATDVSFQRVKSELLRFSVFALAATLVMSPWIIRNAILTGRFIPTMSVTGLAAFQGLYIVKNYGSGKNHVDLIWEAVAKQNEVAREMGLPFKEKGTEVFPQFYSTEDELRYYNHLGEIVVDEFKQNPSSLWQAIKFNAVAFWFQGRTVKATIYNYILSIPFFFLALAGLSLGIIRKYPLAPLVLFIGSFYVAHLLIMAIARYYIPLVPLISIMAAIAIVWLGERFLRKPGPAKSVSKVQAV